MSKTLDRNQFYAEAQKTPGYGRYKAKMGSVAASYMLGILFEQFFKLQDPQGFFAAGAMPKQLAVIPPNAVIKYKDATALRTITDRIDLMLDGDVLKVNQREAYIVSLKNKALNGLLRVELAQAGNTETEANYYLAPPPTVPAPGAPPIPPKPPAMINANKAIAWVTSSVQGDKTPFRNLIRDLEKTDGTWPFGSDDAILQKIWRTTVQGAPPFRPMNPATPYPSSIGGLYIIKNVIRDMSTQALPARGDAQWIDWSLFLLGALMTAQGFPDGNKRVTRTVYALMMISGGVDFVAPSGAYGGRLAQMM